MTPNIPLKKLKLVCWWFVSISQVSQIYSLEGFSGLRKDDLNMWFYQPANPTIFLYNKDNVWSTRIINFDFHGHSPQSLIGALCLEKEKGCFGYLSCGPALTHVLCLGSIALGHLIQGHTCERQGPLSIDRISAIENHSSGGRSQPCRWVVIAEDEDQRLSSDLHPWQTAFWIRISFHSFAFKNA